MISTEWGPDDPVKIAAAAKLLRKTYGRSTAAGIRAWAKLGDVDGMTHYGKGVPWHAVADVLEARHQKEGTDPASRQAFLDSLPPDTTYHLAYPVKGAPVRIVAFSPGEDRIVAVSRSGPWSMGAAA